MGTRCSDAKCRKNTDMYPLSLRSPYYACNFGTQKCHKIRYLSRAQYLGVAENFLWSHFHLTYISRTFTPTMPTLRNDGKEEIACKITFNLFITYTFVEGRNHSFECITVFFVMDHMRETRVSISMEMFSNT